ncbi:MAG: serine/threonine protein kinase [Limnothrix sp. RL_2_0]|nr:serine/threonine protein kinase [Limnothrix sp. RL_2_0]
MSNLLEKNSNALIVGSIIQGRYQVLNKIKGGALSRTYLVQDMGQPNEPKCVLKHYPYNKEIPRLYKTNMRLFLKEAKHLQVLSIHPQIPRLIDYFGITDQGWYLIQELVDGRLLNNMLPMSEYSDNCWSCQDVAQFIHDVCEPLQFIHSQKIIHCDLKPNNIIRRTTDDQIVLIDFGSAQYIPGFQTNEDASVASLRTKITVSPSGYLAPEQLNGQPHACSDFYALGIIAIQAWTGLDPARMKKDSHTGEVVWDQYVRIDDPEACRQLVSIIARMVQPDISDRYRHARDLLADLDVFLNTFSVEEETQLDYNHVSFEDSSLFKKPEEDLFDPDSLDDIEIPVPESFSKETFIQEDLFKQTLIQEDILDFGHDELSMLPDVGEGEEENEQDAEQQTTSAELTPEMQSTPFKRRKKGVMGLPMVAVCSVAVVVANALLITFGLQHLIGGMVASDTPQLDDDFQRAQDAYAQGAFEEAIAIAKAIPQQSPAYESAQTTVTQWEQEWQAKQQKVEAIAAAHAAGDWQAVVADGKSLGENPLFRAKVGTMIEEAQFQIDVAAYQRVQKAFELATAYDFTTALNTLKEAPPNSKFANVIDEKVTEYEGKKQVRAQYNLQQAVNHAEAREFSEAVAFLKQIPPEASQSELAQIKIIEYTEKQQIKEAYERWSAAQAQNKAARFVKNSPMAMDQTAQPAAMVSQVNPGLMWQNIA